MNKKETVLLTLIVCSFFLTACSAPLEKQCSTDADCVPAACCHATDVVNRAYAPDCSQQFCTAVCQPGTLDCSQGEIKCLKHTCMAVMMS